MKTEQWYILNRDGSILDEVLLPERPADARPTKEDEIYTPWYKEDEHIHVENGIIEGIHARGTLEHVREALSLVLQKEKELLEKFGNEEDILLTDALSFLQK